MHAYVCVHTYMKHVAIEISEEMQEERQEKESFYFSDIQQLVICTTGYMFESITRQKSLQIWINTEFRLNIKTDLSTP